MKSVESSSLSKLVSRFSQKRRAVLTYMVPHEDRDSQDSIDSCVSLHLQSSVNLSLHRMNRAGVTDDLCSEELFNKLEAKISRLSFCSSDLLRHSLWSFAPLLIRVEATPLPSSSRRRLTDGGKFMKFYQVFNQPTSIGVMSVSFLFCWHNRHRFQFKLKHSEMATLMS